jgi:hypothetical protein
MRTPIYWRPAIGICAAVALAGCGARMTPAPNTIETSPQDSRISSAAKAQNLLYISDLGANDVAVYTYPKASLVTKLTGFGAVSGLCTNKAGDVFVVDEAGPVNVFAHGGDTPVRKLTTAGAPYGCSVDPGSGNRALTQLSAYEHGAIAVYLKAKGTAKIYEDKEIDATWFCGYDGSGNLFADAWDRDGNVELVELPKGGKGFKKFKLGKTFNKAGGVQWDGKYVAVGNYGAGVVYRVTETGRVAQTVTLKGGDNVEQFWISGSTLIGPAAQSPGIAPFWHYPGGGNAYNNTIDDLSWPFGATLSLAH